MTRPQEEQVILFGVTQADSRETAADTTAAPAPRSPAGTGAAAGSRGAYRPGYELIAEQILELIARSQPAPGRPDAHRERDRRAARDQPHGRARGDQDPLSARPDQGAKGPRALRRRRRRNARHALGRLLPADRPRSHLHALRVPPRPGSGGEPPRRHPGDTDGAARHRGGRGAVPRGACDGAAGTVPPRRRRLPSQHRGGIAQPVPPGGSARSTAPADAVGHHRTARDARRPRGRSGRGARSHLPGDPRRRAGRRRHTSPPCTWTRRSRTISGRSSAACSAVSRASGRTRRR